eukprot:CAMPEP_0195040452 /NCGR_PEP_ID=MMETSP0326_2-20130528/80338_1 /TAXON_ID=2866 ORGANISM="Crypthecodinium cohnii, Strain Seligo" /NCGR_SAMPLE_ID=MMETSP0326_2 /ASSEMBLY_ACC=CAM_ASM_000348 /LENGTH=140 /DNA_ID=CAMNT_0040067367 /DNA_START=173 /DNA_END=598 /DNA_ORIENTATION=+
MPLGILLDSSRPESGRVAPCPLSWNATTASWASWTREPPHMDTINSNSNSTRQATPTLQVQWSEKSTRTLPPAGAGRAGRASPVHGYHQLQLQLHSAGDTDLTGPVVREVYKEATPSRVLTLRLLLSSLRRMRPGSKKRT